MLSDREKEILNNIVETWDEGDNPLPGHMSYGEVFDLLDKLGLKRPRWLTSFLENRNHLTNEAK